MKAKNERLKLFFKKKSCLEPVYYFHDDLKMRDIQNCLMQKDYISLRNIVKAFKKLQRFRAEDAYIYIKSLCLYCTSNSEYGDFKKSILTGVVSSNIQFNYKKNHGSIVAICGKQASLLLKKSRTFLNRYLNTTTLFEKITPETVNDLFSNEGENGENHGVKMFSICNIMSDYDMQTEFYFLKKQPFIYRNKCINFLITDLRKKDNTITFKHYKKRKNNYKYLNKWMKMKSLEKKLRSCRKEIKKIKEQNIENLKKLEKHYRSIIISKIDFDNEDLKSTLKNYLNRKSSLMKEQVFEFAFLIKFCSSAAYRRLYIFSRGLLPPPSSVESHFKKQVNMVNKLLTDPSEIDMLLDSYWLSNKDKINIPINSIDSYKIQISLGVDAASLTSFNKTKYNKKNPKEEKIDQKLKGQIKEMKAKIIKCLLNGEDSITPKKNGAILPNGEILDDVKAKHFFAFLLQPLDWRLPIMALHLSKSEAGHFSLNEYQDLLTLITKINSHPHFEIHFVSADGEQALSKLHSAIYERYKEKIKEVLDGTLSISDFCKFVCEKCRIIAVLDMLHGVKTGRSKLLQNTIKLGNNCDLISAESLSVDLGMFDQVLGDQTAWGKMRDIYPLKLFNTRNAITLFEKNKTSAGFYVTIYSLIIETFRNIYLDRELRLKLADFCLIILLSLLKSCDKLPEETGFRVQSRSNNKYSWFNDKSGIIKLSNTLISLCICLRNEVFCNHFGLERLSSHPVENFFGQFRNHYCGQYKTNFAFSFAVRAAISLEFESKLSVIFTIPKRENFAGAHLQFKDSKNEIYDKYNLNNAYSNKELFDIAQNLFQVATDHQIKFEQKTKDFIQELNLFFINHPSTVYKHFSLVKGIAIYNRLTSSNEDNSYLTIKPLIFPKIPTSDQIYQQINAINAKLFIYNSELRHLTNIREGKNKSTIISNDKNIKLVNRCLISQNNIDNLIIQNKRKVMQSHHKYIISNNESYVKFSNINDILNINKQNLQMEKIIEPIFKNILNHKIYINNKYRTLTYQYLKIYSDFKNSEVTGKKKQNESSKEIKPFNFASDSIMYIDEIEKINHSFYDMNNITKDPVSSYFDYKNRTSWTYDEIKDFICAYSKYHKNFKRISEQITTKNLKDIIEFYYQHKLDLGLKRYDIFSKKRHQLNSI